MKNKLFPLLILLTVYGSSFAQTQTEKPSSNDIQRRQEYLNHLRSSGPLQQSGWSHKVTTRIKPLIVFNGDTAPPNTFVTVQVKTDSEGKILEQAVTESSGFAAWNDAVMTAIKAAKNLPKDDDGKLPATTVILNFRP